MGSQKQGTGRGLAQTVGRRASRPGSPTKVPPARGGGSVCEGV